MYVCYQDRYVGLTNYGPVINGWERFRVWDLYMIDTYVVLIHIDVVLSIDMPHWIK